jgi:hypothetical protein
MRVSLSSLVYHAQLPILVVLGCLGLWSPWSQSGLSRPTSLTWIALSSLLARSFGLSLQTATTTVTIFAIVLCAAGAGMRLWSRMGAARRNQAGARTLGALLVVASISILMPPSGALLFVFGAIATVAVATWLASTPANTLHGARAQAPRADAAEERSSLRVLSLALAQESFPVGFAACMASLAWSYSAQLLIRALFVCFGAALVIRALLPRTANVLA